MDGGYHELLEVFPLERPTCNLGIFYCPGIRAAMVLIGLYLWVGLFYMAAFHLVYGSGRRVSRVGRRGASFSVGGVRGDQRWGGTKLGSCLDASYFRSGMASCDFILFASFQMKGQREPDWWCGSFRCVAWDIFFQHWDMLLLLRVDVYIVYAPVLWGRMWGRHNATLIPIFIVDIGSNPQRPSWPYVDLTSDFSTYLLMRNLGSPWHLISVCR